MKDQELSDGQEERGARPCQPAGDPNGLLGGKESLHRF